METNYKLYVHINKIDGKKYYGITSEKNPNNRWRNGKGYKENEYFTNAIEKHGWDNFEHIILFENLTESEAHALEIEHIAKYKTKNREFGYNLTDGGEGTRGYHHTEEAKKKIAKAKKGENNPMYGNTGEKNPMYGKGYLISGENHPMYGKNHAKESKQKMSKAHKGKQLSEETKKKMSKARKGKFCGKNNSYAKSVICITTKKIFFTGVEGANYYNITSSSHISSCCKGKLKSAGKHNGQKLVWRYLNHKHNFTYRIKGTMVA